MNKITKIMALLMVSVLMVMSFTACAGDKNAIKKVIETYSQAGMELDFDKAQTCLDPESEQYEALLDGKDGAFASLEEAGIKEADLKKLVKDFSKYVETQVKDINISGETATAVLVTSTPDMNSMGSDVMNEYMEYKEFTQEDLMSKYTSEEAIGELMLDMTAWMIEEKVPNLEKVSASQNISLKKIDGKWLITEIKDIE